MVFVARLRPFLSFSRFLPLWSTLATSSAVVTKNAFYVTHPYFPCAIISTCLSCVKKLAMPPRAINPLWLMDKARCTTSAICLVEVLIWEALQTAFKLLFEDHSLPFKASYLLSQCQHAQKLFRILVLSLHLCSSKAASCRKERKLQCFPLLHWFNH